MRFEIKPGFAVFVLALTLMAGERVWPFLLAAGLHEAAHLLAIWAAGGRAYALTLRFADAEIAASSVGYCGEIACALAGPAANLVLFRLFCRTAPEFAAINLLLGCYNLLPVQVLDGGRALRAALCLLLPQEMAEHICAAVGFLTCAGLFACGAYATVRLEAGLWPVGLAIGLSVRFVRLQEKMKGKAA